jgi:uncharacterized protein
MAPLTWLSKHPPHALEPPPCYVGHCQPATSDTATALSVKARAAGRLYNSYPGAVPIPTTAHELRTPSTMSIRDLEEIQQARHPELLVRIPAEQDVPVTRRVMAIVDSAPMQRLNHISQLGLVSLVYPGARHTRMEHSLGVYRLALAALEHLEADERFAATVTERDARVFLLAALLHDVGHWPMCHPIEDMRLSWVVDHEERARDFLCHGPLSERITRDWEIDPHEVAELLAPTDAATLTPAQQLLRSVLNGPIDVDKLDYLQRDSLHAGVPYGRNFDIRRLLGSLCVADCGRRIAITSKGKTAAEMLVFARYVMFSEVYWHHAVRSATAMLQRLVYGLGPRTQPEHWLAMSDAGMQAVLLNASQGTPLAPLASGLFGPQRGLYKRLLGFNFVEHAAAHQALAGRSYNELVHCAELLTARLASVTSVQLDPGDILIDAPPAKHEVQFRLSVRLAQGHFQPLAEVSPVVRSLALEQFDNYVKRVHVFIHPDKRGSLNLTPERIATELIAAAQELGDARLSSRDVPVSSS